MISVMYFIDVEKTLVFHLVQQGDTIDIMLEHTTTFPEFAIQNCFGQLVLFKSYMIVEPYLQIAMLNIVIQVFILL
jgi:hypothetical protein